MCACVGLTVEPCTTCERNAINKQPSTCNVVVDVFPPLCLLATHSRTHATDRYPNQSRSVGSVVGLVSWELNKAQALLKEQQAVLEEQGRQVHALARGVLQEHEDYRNSRDGARADGGGGGSKRQAGEELELMNKLTYGLGEANVQVQLQQ